MNSPDTKPINAGTLSRILAIFLITCAFYAPGLAQTPGGTSIDNQASATYSDGTNTYSTVSNTVTVTVSNVSGLAMTPDGGSNPTVVAGQTGILFSFRVTNTGNFSDQVRFLASGASVYLSGSSPATITRAVIDVDNSGTINAGDTDIKTNGADVLSASIAQNGFINLLVEVSVNAGATAGQSVQVFVGDAGGGSPFDNQPADSSANEVRTVSSSSVNGLREARGDISAEVVNDALLQLTLTAPAGPVNLGSDITYTWQVANAGVRDVTGVTLNGSTQVYIIAPIPLNTVLTSGQTFPAGTLYSTDALSTPPLSASWTNVAPPLNTVTRVAFPVGATLAAGASSSPINMVVTVNTGIDATNPIDEIGDVFGRNSTNSIITDQSGDATPNNGDGNADFNEGYAAGSGHGVIQRTLLAQVGAVLIGPSGAPGASGPTDQNDDYTNKSVNTGISGIPPGGTTNAAGQVVFVNTIQNTGNANDTFTIDAPTVPAGFTVEISTDGGGAYTDVSSGGSVSLAINFGSTADVHVRVTSPAGQTVLTGFDTVVRATSTNTPGANNRTIDRLYTGFIRLDKTMSISNPTGVGGANDPVPGAVITYTITYTNVSLGSGGAGSVNLTATNIVITENGSAAPNNWAATTTQVLVPAPSDSNGGTITDGDTNGAVTATTTHLKDSVPSLAPQASGTFTFRRQIN